MSAGRRAPGRPGDAGLTPPNGPAIVGAPSGTPAEATPPRAVDWPAVGWFLAIAFGGAWVVGLALWGLVSQGGPALASVATLALAVVYMPLPLVAGLVVELRRRGERPRTLLVREWRRLRARPALFGWTVLWGVAAIAAALGVVYLAGVGAAWLGVPGAGTPVTTPEQLAAELVALGQAPLSAEALAALPPLPVLVGLMFVQGIVAGLTVNALFAFGEEYGWRGVLADLLAPLGTWRQHLFIGVVWGLWHAPAIIFLGHNYGSEWGWGVPAMVAFCVPFGFILAWVRERSTVFAAAIGHGVLNGVAGGFLIVVAGESRLIAPPVGLVTALAASVVAAVLWTAWPTRPASVPQSASP